MEHLKASIASFGYTIIVFGQFGSHRDFHSGFEVLVYSGKAVRLYVCQTRIQPKPC